MQSSGGRARVRLTRSSPLRWYIRCRKSSISRRLVSWVRLWSSVSSATHEGSENTHLNTSMNPWADWGMLSSARRITCDGYEFGAHLDVFLV